jgi:protein-S-isoprenylcysteine O-methyltransferase Ste14
MRATEFEFRFRFWLIAGLFFLGAAVPARFSVLDLLHYRLGPVVPVAICLGALLGAAVIRTWAAAYLDPAVIHSKAVHTEQLVADGPYRHVRNPLYLGTLLLGVGFGLFFAPNGFILVVAGLYLLTLRLIGREEAQLAAEQGQSYLEYVRRVPRMIPSIKPRLPAGTTPPNWPYAVRGELMGWLFFLLVAVFFGAGHHVAQPIRSRFIGFGVLAVLFLHLLVQPRQRGDPAGS